MRLSRNSGIGASLVLTLSLITTACNPLGNLELVITAAQVAIPAISAAGAIPPNTSAEIVKYLGAVNTAVGQTTTELASTDSSAQKATKITGFFAAAAIPVLPTGTDQRIVSVIQSVDAAIGVFLTSIGSAKRAPGLPAASVATVKAPKGLAKANITSSDVQSQLKELKQRNDANIQSLEMLQKVLAK